MTATIERPSHIDAYRWQRAPWHARQKLIDAANRDRREHEAATPEPVDPSEWHPNADSSLSQKVDDGLGHGLEPEQISERLGISLGTIEQSMRKCGRVDLARPFSAARNRQRRQPCPTGCGKLIWPGTAQCMKCSAAQRTTFATCPICGEQMRERNARGDVRTVCSSKCGGPWNARLQAKARDEWVEDVANLLAGGSSPEQIVAEYGLSSGAISRRLQRAGRRELAKHFEHLRNIERWARSST